ncbi:Erythronate-4-phosphate dehydrogenase (EC 1.1.1.290) [uncultured Gammaproteobacteria bacterium]|uniref:4-phosphoerythronate dehydrogenase n=1 Tax=Bathymodiolus heckerae thiotrophic gill symbiont TaxID=1052212 RepID=UPI0010B39B6E|nr:4-phosphoerythronate dehydrogenase [Bathymodiolus heckerae thiotrophic gill symbiont]CAC9592815.1 Erythronate-4-phosphate dehydrogenase (EC 1.1.1.290) [uncultured Gammaproteobacteria bacterium]CAC9599627.1 Erythronate-4-phosphate dehydrogenase (EC 1.1.1.290) [uncultured Gammaproteobacteria bacterium]CAC9600865.1 Erythronate-4-phosphate dehydrogenase (EC 1.1.1.290) [uncultured Gammaproteobacteria bacterium]CAC9608000.1 Erythronate-4-phosphate dehydrogenase (EC 1.1.1.290) [uncultured Gammaprot
MKLIIDDACYAHSEIFSQFGEIITMAGRDINADSVRDADVLIVRSRTQVNKQLLKDSSIKFVGSTVAGLDHVDQDYLKAHNIGFFSAQGCNSMAVAEFVISAILNLAEKYNFNYQDKTLGIIGVGNVGSRLAAKAELLGIKTLLNDPIRQDNENLPNFVDLDTALRADIVTFHTPLTFDGDYPSCKLLNKANFHNISDKTILFNAARGGVIVEEIWEKTKTLENVIDCWENEPNINKNLQETAYLASPHIAGHSVDAKFMGSFMVYEALCKFLGEKQQENIKNLINPGILTLESDNLLDCLNEVYDFKQDTLAIKNIENFEIYRRNYPIRYEWPHFKSKITLPIV